MLTTNHLTNLDRAHSLIMEMVEQGEISAVLFTITSALSAISQLDNSAESSHFLNTAILNLNLLADTCQRRELADDTAFADSLSVLDEPTAEDWDFADLSLNDEAQYD